MDEFVVLVDQKDRKIGLEEKIKAHSNGGRLHRAFSIYVFNSKGEMMLQQRASSKYHGGDLWTNTVCGHPRDREDVAAAAHRRLMEEMGFDCSLREVFSTIYHTDIGEGMTEHEFLHVFFGTYDKDPKLNPEEAKAFKWIDMEDLASDASKRPGIYSPWMRIILDKVIEAMKR